MPGRPAVWLVALVALATLFVDQIIPWPAPIPPLFSFAAGFGLVLNIWIGPRGLVVILIHGLLTVALAFFSHSPSFSGAGSRELFGQLPQSLFAMAEALLGWWLFRKVLARHYFSSTQASRTLFDPRSVSLFLLLVPGLAVGSLALLRAALESLLFGPANWDWNAVLTIWFSRALGIVLLTPLVLLLMSPRPRGEWEGDLDSSMEEKEQVPGPKRSQVWQGDFVETAGLTLAAGLFELLLALTYGHTELAAWQVWGVPLLLVIWASFRQGPLGGMIVAAGSAVFPLSLMLLHATSMPPFLVQGHLLAQGTTALLVASSAAWIRVSEALSRRVVRRIPVVLYSTRVGLLSAAGPLPAAPASPADHDDLGPSVRLLGSLFAWTEMTFVSPACRDLMGRSPSELLGPYTHWLDRVHPSDREVLVAAMAQLGRQKEPVTCEYRVVIEQADGPGRAAHLRPPRPGPRLTPVQPLAVILNPDRWARDTLSPHFGPDGQLDGWDSVVLDITEQRVLADDLRRTSSMFHALVANLPAGVFFVQGTNGYPILVNTRARQLLGRREDTAASLEHLSKIYQFHKPNGSPYPFEELPVWMALRHGLTSMRDDIVVHRPDGRRIPLVTWATPIDLVGRGKPDAAVWVLEDLSTLRQAEAALRESEARLRTVIETMAEGLVVQDATGTIVECNPAACHILGLNENQLKGMSSLDPNWKWAREDGSPFPGTEHPAMVSLRTGQPVRNVIMGVPRFRPAENGPPDKKEMGWMLVNSMPLPGSQGPIPARLNRSLTSSVSPKVLTTFVDMTAHLQTLEGLRASEERFRGLVESLPLALLQLDMNARPEFFNSATLEMTKYSFEDMAGSGDNSSDWMNVFAAPDQIRIQEMLNSSRAGQMSRTEVRFRTKSGEDKVGFLMAQPRRDSGARDRIIGTTLLLMDVTRERQLEAELQRAQRMELVGRLASGIAHDFNNILTAILVLVHLAKERLPEHHPVRSDLEGINAASEQACNLAAQMLTFGKTRRSPGDDSAIRGDLNRVARRTLDLLRSTLPSTIEIEAVLSEGDLPVLVDDTQLQQVMMNLCLNARDAMPRGGRMTVKSMREEKQGLDWVLLSVEDTGQGMPEPVLSRVFDPFFSTKENGTGLGLAVVHQIAESHGGRVEVSTKIGKGSRFDVWLPSSFPA